ncbi:MAG: methyltransferase [Coriobacteriales bacterium]|jgi:23S rRNA (uracil1939-C5)-methyltransferase|nr:methyltransferase [Coriobacteriales bacterium]
MKLSAPSFFQVNSFCAEALIGLVADALDDANVPTSANVLDLYCGAGTFTLPLAKTYARICAIESAGSSIRDLRRNLKDNGLDDNVCVIGGDVARELPAILAGKPDSENATDDAANDANAQNTTGACPTDYSAAVIDPPRAGLSDEALRVLADARIPHIVYVSCNPSTLAHDIKYLNDYGYTLMRTTPVDMFPQTEHVESVSLLSL